MVFIEYIQKTISNHLLSISKIGRNRLYHRLYRSGLGHISYAHNLFTKYNVIEKKENNDNDYCIGFQNNQ